MCALAHARIDQVQTKPITQFSFRATVRSPPKTEFYDLIRWHEIAHMDLLFIVMALFRSALFFRSFFDRNGQILTICQLCHFILVIFEHRTRLLIFWNKRPITSNKRKQIMNISLGNMPEIWWTNRWRNLITYNKWSMRNPGEATKKKCL